MMAHLGVPNKNRNLRQSQPTHPPTIYEERTEDSESEYSESVDQSKSIVLSPSPDKDLDRRF